MCLPHMTGREMMAALAAVPGSQRLHLDGRRRPPHALAKDQANRGKGAPGNEPSRRRTGAASGTASSSSIC